jgi:hypothetical protein
MGDLSSLILEQHSHANTVIGLSFLGLLRHSTAAMTRLVVRILRKIVKNDAMLSDPEEIYGWRVVLLACSVSFIGNLDSRSAIVFW